MDINEKPDFGSRFRLWVRDLYYQNREEKLTFNENPHSIQQYWDTYKWWLRREYRHQLKKEHGKNNG